MLADVHPGQQDREYLITIHGVITFWARSEPWSLPSEEGGIFLTVNGRLAQVVGSISRVTQFFIRVHQSGMSFEEVLSLARAADRHGYDGISLYDRLRAPGLECWTTLTAIATLTSRLRVIPLVLAATYRHPAVVAKMAATLDRITEGRLILGLGAGGDREDHAAYGLPWAPTAARVARLQEAVAILRFLWSGAQGPFAGAHYGTIIGPGQPTPHRPGGPPVLIGGHGEQHLLRAVAESGDVANIGFDLSLEEWEAKWRLLTGYMVQVGRSPEALRLSHNATVILTEGCEGVRPHTSEVARRYGISEVRARVATASGVVGGPRECADRLRIRTFRRDFLLLAVSGFA